VVSLAEQKQEIKLKWLILFPLIFRINRTEAERKRLKTLRTVEEFMLEMIQRFLVYSSVIMLAGLLGANVYNSIVDAPNWGAAIPQSIDAAKHYFIAATPGTFYRFFSPATQIVTLIALIASWNGGWRIRGLAAAALVLSVSGDVLTFAYFYPRNSIMFGSEIQSVEALRDAWSGWSTMNWFRSAVCLFATISELGVLSRLERHFAMRGQHK